MTRKCVLCKETNYKNTYSFFSAPKDRETRKKWQDAIGIDNYSVNDDTYVCSKHFYKNDIITHWVSGVPPHVIKIKYKKCRLRPGAVPNKNMHDMSNVQNAEEDYSDMQGVSRNDLLQTEGNPLQESIEKGQTYLIPRQENRINKESENYNKTTTSYKIISNSEEYEYTDDDQSQSNEMQMETNFVSQKGTARQSSQSLDEIESETHCSTDVVYKSTQEQGNTIEKFPSEETRKTFDNDTSIYYIEISDSFKNEDVRMTESWDESKLIDHISFSREMEANGTLTETYVTSQMLDNSKENDDDSISNKTDKDNMLFEDLLEVCTEAALPPGWSCMVTSKGHSTTIVYLFMGMTKAGMPFTEKQVFINSDMTLRCTATNREINVLHHNLLKDNKRNKVRSLMDVEEFIDEFDQRIICEGVYSSRGIFEIQAPRLAYNDGINLRHISCPLIVNNDSSRCSKCIALSQIVTQRSKTLSTLYLPADYNTFDSTRQKRRTRLQRMVKRVRESDRRYEFVKNLNRQ